MQLVSRKLLIATLLICGATVAAPAVSGAAGPAQKCSGPASTSQSGRATVAPGINGLAEVQTASAPIHLFQCVPATTTMGSGTLTISLKTPAAVTCSAITNAHSWLAAGRILWKNGKASTFPMVIATTGSNQLANVSGKINFGLFQGHSFTGQFHYKAVVSPNGHTVTDACANKVAPGGSGRISVVGFLINTTKPFTIT